MVRYRLNFIRATALVLTVVSFCRLFFGIDFTDESQYIAQAFGPLVGGKFFLTDRLFQQSGSIWATPFLWLYIKFFPTKVGMVIFFRLLYFAAALFTSALLYRALKKSLKAEESLALAILPVLYVPFSIPSISYNTMAVILTVLSLSLLRLVKDSKNNVTTLSLSASAAMAIYSYPTIAIVFFLLFVFEYRKSRALRPLLLRSGAAAIGFLVAFSVPLIMIGWKEIETNLHIAQKVSLLTFSAKMEISKAYLGILMPNLISLGAIVLTCLILFFRKKIAELAALPILAIFYLYVATSLPLEISSGYLIFGTLMSLVLIAMKAATSKSRYDLSVEVFVGLLIGSIMGSTSSNGIVNAALGFSISMIFIIEAVAIKNRRFPILAWLSVALVLSYSPWAYFYREDRLPELTYQVKSGPYFGIYTNSSKGHFVEQIESDLKSLPNSARSLFVYDSFPTGYFLSDLAPLTFMYYIHPMFINASLRSEVIDMFVKKEVQPDVVLETQLVPVTKNESFLVKNPDQNIYNDPFWNFFKNNPNYRVFLARPQYTIYIRKILN